MCLVEKCKARLVKYLFPFREVKYETKFKKSFQSQTCHQIRIEAIAESWVKMDRER